MDTNKSTAYAPRPLPPKKKSQNSKNIQQYHEGNTRQGFWGKQVPSNLWGQTKKKIKIKRKQQNEKDCDCDLNNVNNDNETGVNKPVVIIVTMVNS